MARSKFRRAPRVENLESRELLSTVASSQAPSNDAQYMLQMLNLVRTNPQAAVQYIESNITPDITLTLNHYGVDLNATLNEIASSKPLPPLAWSPALAQSAQNHSQDMATNGFQSHSGSDSSSPPQRMQQAGYNPSTDGENVYAYADSIDQAMEAFLLDWGVSDAGHRANILQPNVSAQGAYRDVGIGLVNSNGPNGVGPLVVTQDFGSQANEQAQVVGVAYKDLSGTGNFTDGAGIGGVTITAINLATGQVSQTQTWASGGYELGLNPGHYQLIASQNDQVISSRTIDINNVNIEEDFNLAGTQQGGSASAAIAAARSQASPPVNATPTASPTPPPRPATSPPVASPIAWNWTSWTAKKDNG